MENVTFLASKRQLAAAPNYQQLVTSGRRWPVCTDYNICINVDILRNSNKIPLYIHKFY